MLNRKLTDQDKKFIRDNHNELTVLELSDVVGKRLATVYSHMKKNKISIFKDKKTTVWYLKEP